MQQRPTLYSLFQDGMKKLSVPFGVPTVVTINDVIKFMEDQKGKNIPRQQFLESPKCPPYPNLFLEVNYPRVPPLAIPHPELPIAMPIVDHFAIWMVSSQKYKTQLWNHVCTTREPLQPETHTVSMFMLIQSLQEGIDASAVVAEQYDEHGHPMKSGESYAVQLSPSTLEITKTLQQNIPGVPKENILVAVDFIIGPHFSFWETGLYLLNTGQAWLEEMSEQEKRSFVAGVLPAIACKKLVVDRDIMVGK